MPAGRFQPWQRPFSPHSPPVLPPAGTGPFAVPHGLLWRSGRHGWPHAPSGPQPSQHGPLFLPPAWRSRQPALRGARPCHGLPPLWQVFCVSLLAGGRHLGQAPPLTAWAIQSRPACPHSHVQFCRKTGDLLQVAQALARCLPADASVRLCPARTSALPAARAPG